MKNKTYHSGIKLRVLRELKGLKEKELAKLLKCDFTDILFWEEKGVPNEAISLISLFFEVNENIFFENTTSDLMLRKLMSTALEGSELEKELKNRFDEFYKNKKTEINLSSLGLLTVPDIIFSFHTIKKIDLSDNLLTEIPDRLQDLIKSGCQLIIKNNFIHPDLPQSYNIKKEKQKQYNEKKITEKIKIIQLTLENIGIYKNLKVDFKNNLTVFIGVNGAGKTTILKALSLAILGPRDSIRSEATLLRSITTPSREDSKITLKATINDVEYSNEIILIHDSDTGEIIITGQQFKELYHTPSTLKNLILCLSEKRNNSNSNEKQNLDTHPRILDLLPLLREDDQSCMKNFTSWWANLEASKISHPNDQNKIDLCFEVFSKFMGEKIQSDGLKKVKPNTELWLKYDTGKSAPFNLASQGYQAVMGWVGFIIQRMIEANENYSQPLSQPAVVIIDEIDQLLSIKWQQKILSILREFFPNIQWIISTHSPMILTDLDKHQVVQLHERDGNIIAENNEVDLWMWQYGDILRRYFEISTTPPMFQKELLIKEISTINVSVHSTPLFHPIFLHSKLGSVFTS